MPWRSWRDRQVSVIDAAFQEFWQYFKWSWNRNYLGVCIDFTNLCKAYSIYWCYKITEWSIFEVIIQRYEIREIDTNGRVLPTVGKHIWFIGVYEVPRWQDDETAKSNGLFAVCSCHKSGIAIWSRISDQHLRTIFNELINIISIMLPAIQFHVAYVINWLSIFYWKV